MLLMLLSMIVVVVVVVVVDDNIWFVQGSKSKQGKCFNFLFSFPLCFFVLLFCVSITVVSGCSLVAFVLKKKKKIICIVPRSKLHTSQLRQKKKELLG